MTHMPVTKPLFNWVTTLKFKIVTMAVVTGVMSAMVTAQLVLTTTQADIQRLLLQSDSDDGETTAALLSTKLDMLQNTLKAVAHQVAPELWQDREAMTRYLVEKHALEGAMHVGGTRHLADRSARRTSRNGVKRHRVCFDGP